MTSREPETLAEYFARYPPPTLRDVEERFTWEIDDIEITPPENEQEQPEDVESP